MSMKNQICKECGSPFHHCDSCGFDSANSNGYCRSECLNKNTYTTVELYNKLDELELNQVFVNTYDEYEYLIFKGKYFSLYDIVEEKEILGNILIDNSWTKVFVEEK